MQTQTRTSPAALFDGLDAFIKGYIEAMFFTSTGTDDVPHGASLADMADDAMSQMFEDCERFKVANLDVILAAISKAEDLDLEHAGRDFWYTRNGHGCGFWDGDWPEPYATRLTDAAKMFGDTSLYRGDDGRLYLS